MSEKLSATSDLRRGHGNAFARWHRENKKRTKEALAAWEALPKSEKQRERDKDAARDRSENADLRQYSFW